MRGRGYDDHSLCGQVSAYTHTPVSNVANYFAACAEILPNTYGYIGWVNGKISMINKTAICIFMTSRIGSEVRVLYMSFELYDTSSLSNVGCVHIAVGF